MIFLSRVVIIIDQPRTQIGQRNTVIAKATSSIAWKSAGSPSPASFHDLEYLVIARLEEILTLIKRGAGI